MKHNRRGDQRKIQNNNTDMPYKGIKFVLTNLLHKAWSYYDFIDDFLPPIHADDNKCVLRSKCCNKLCTLWYVEPSKWPFGAKVFWQDPYV